MERDYLDLIWRARAVDLVAAKGRSARKQMPAQTVPLEESAGHHLASSIEATEDLPPTDIATMDGFAIDSEGSYPFSIRPEEVFPEDEPPSLEGGEASRIATGAPLPDGADAVLRREDAEVAEEQLFGPDLEPGTYTYEQGSNVSQGELLFEQGERLTANDTIFLADLGYDAVDIAEPFSVGILATGTEIHEGKHTDLDSPMLAALIREWGHRATYEGTVPDDRQTVLERIESLCSEYDVVVTTGGTSVGHKDHVIGSLEELGSIEFHRVRIRPGKPIAMATLDNATAFAIPGKPVGAYTVATLVMRPFFVANPSLPAISGEFSHDLELGTDGFEYAIPVEYDDGIVRPLGHTDSDLPIYEETFNPSVLSSSTRATRADGFVLRTESLHTGEQVAMIPYSAVE